MTVQNRRATLAVNALIAGVVAAPALAVANAAFTDFQAAQLDAYRHDRAWHGDLLASL